MQQIIEAKRGAARSRVLLSIPIAFLFLAAVGGWLLALLRHQGSWLLEAAVLAVAALAVAYLTVMQYAARRPGHAGFGAARAGRSEASQAASQFADALTSLPSRGWLQQTLRAELARSRRYHRRLSLVVLGIDHFVRINREHGDVAGDWVLETVGSMLRANIRESDHVARIGADAFALVLAETSEKGALQLAEKLRGAIAAEGAGDRPAARAGTSVAITVSAGVAAAKESDSVEDLLRRAEAAAMTARRSGGDRVATATF